MAVIGGTVAGEYGITREMQDSWALRSQQRWSRGEAEGKFEQERFFVEIKNKKGTAIISRDEAPRPETDIAALSKLQPLFIKDGTITAGKCAGNQ